MSQGSAKLKEFLTYQWGLSAWPDGCEPDQPLTDGTRWVQLPNGAHICVTRTGQISQGPAPLQGQHIGRVAAEAQRADDEDCHWVTLDNGAHVCISNRSGKVTMGPTALRGRSIEEARAEGQPKAGAIKGLRVKTVEEAYNALTQGQRVILTKRQMVSTLLDKLAVEAKRARDSGGKLDINLCNVTVEGASIFCEGHKNISRVNMPQLSGSPVKGSKADALPRTSEGGVDLGPLFVKHLRDQGIQVTDEQAAAALLKATQNELNGAKVAGIMRAMETGTMPADSGRIFVSQDDYVVDGHHRWAATVGKDFRSDADQDMALPVARVNMPILEVLVQAHKFADDMGLPRVSMGDQPAAPAATAAAAAAGGKPPAPTPKTPSRGQEMAELAEDEEEEDCRWVTLDNGAKVCIQTKTGIITKGPAALTGQHIRDVRSPTKPAGPVPVSRPPRQGWALAPEDEPRQAALDARSEKAVADVGEEVQRAMRSGARVPVGPQTFDELSTDDFNMVYQDFVDGGTERFLPAVFEREAWKQIVDADAWWEEQITAATASMTPEQADEVTRAFVRDDRPYPSEGRRFVQMNREVLLETRLPGGASRRPVTAGALSPAAQDAIVQAAEGEAKRRIAAWDDDTPDEMMVSARVMAKHEWNDFSDEERNEVARQQGRIGRSAPIREPVRWSLFDHEESGYRDTGALARFIVPARAKALWREQYGDTKKMPDWDGMTKQLWKAWKNDSNDGASLALQRAAIDELGANNHLTPEQEDTAAKFIQRYFGDTEIRTYVRALWETNQYLLAKAGKDEVTLYRAVLLPKDKLKQAEAEFYPGGSGTYDGVALPGLKLRQNALQSTSFTGGVPNSWEGAGLSPPNSRRVVLSMKVPRTAVFSLPVFGVNAQEEQEVVVLGTPWKGWTAWFDKALHADTPQYEPGKPVGKLGDWYYRRHNKELRWPEEGFLLRTANGSTHSPTTASSTAATLNRMEAAAIGWPIAPTLRP
jgi:hypothetical protein